MDPIASRIERLAQLLGQKGKCDITLCMKEGFLLFKETGEIQVDPDIPPKSITYRCKVSFDPSVGWSVLVDTLEPISAMKTSLEAEEARIYLKKVSRTIDDTLILLGELLEEEEEKGDLSDASPVTDRPEPEGDPLPDPQGSDIQFKDVEDVNRRVREAAKYLRVGKDVAASFPEIPPGASTDWVLGPKTYSLSRYRVKRLALFYP